MKQSAKTFGYGFSALVLALSGVVISPNVNTASAATVEPFNCTTGTPAADTAYVKTADELAEATKAGVTDTTIVLCNDITLSEDLAILENGLTIDLNGKTLTGNIDAGVKSLTIADDSTAAGTVTGSILFTIGTASRTITVTGGNFTGTAFAKTGSASQAGANEKINIEGGKFTGSLTDGSVAVNKIVAVTGGTFASDPSAYVNGKNVYEGDGLYAVDAANTITATAATTIAAGKDIENAYSLTKKSVGDKVYTGLTFTVTQGDSSKVTITPVRERLATEVSSYKVNFSEAGTYKIKATANDKTAAGVYTFDETTFTVVDAAERSVEDIYMAVPAADEGATFSVADYTGEYATENSLTAAYSVKKYNPETDENEDTTDVTVTAAGAVTVKKAKTGKFVVTVDYKKGDNVVSSFDFSIYSLATATGTQVYNLSDDEDDLKKTVAIDEAWGEPTISDANVISAVRDDENAANVEFKAGSKVGKATVTYTAGSSAWVYNGTTILDGSSAAKKVVPLENVVTVYTYKTIDSNILLPTNTGYSTNDLVKAGSLTVTALTNTDASENAITANTDGVITATAKGITAGKGTDTYTFNLKDGETTIKTGATVKVSLYKNNTVKKIVEYAPVDAEATIAAASIRTNDGTLKSDNEDVTIAGTTVKYTPTTLGATSLVINEVLNDAVVGTGTIEVRAYIANGTTYDYYLAPNEAKTFTLSDPYGTIGLSTTTTTDLKNNGDGTYTFQTSKEDETTYTATFTDVYNGEAATKIGSASGTITVNFHVSDYYLAVSDDEVTVEAGEESDEITVTTSDANQTTWAVTTLDENGEEIPAVDVSFELVSKANSTYKVVASDIATPGEYTITGTLKDGANEIETVTIKVNVTRHIAGITGTFTIESALAEGMVLDVKNAATDNGANVQLYKSNGTAAQQFIFAYDEDSGFYTITNLRSGKVLDVAGAGKAAGTNVQQYDSNDTLAQKWEILMNADGTLTIASALDSNLVLDLAGAGKSNGTNLQVYTANGTKAQRFTIRFVEETFSDGTDSDGNLIDEEEKYIIASALNDEFVIDIAGGSAANGANAQLYADNQTAAQQFAFEFDDAGLVTIKNVGSGKVLDAAGGGRDNGTNVQQYAANGTVAQKWVIEQNDDGTVSFRSVHSGLYLDIAWGSAKDGSNVQLYKGNGTKAQKFSIIKIEEEA